MVQIILGRESRFCTRSGHGFRRFRGERRAKRASIPKSHSGFCGTVLRSNDWKKDLERCAAMMRAAGAEADFATVVRDEDLRDPETEAGSLEFFCTKERIEDAILDCTRNARTVIVNNDAGSFTIVSSRLTHANSNTSLFRRSLNCVADQVRKDLR